MFQSVKELVEEYFSLTGRPVSTMTIDEYAKIKEMSMSTSNRGYVGTNISTVNTEKNEKPLKDTFTKEIPVTELKPVPITNKDSSITELRGNIKEEEEKLAEKPEEERGGMLKLLCSVSG